MSIIVIVKHVQHVGIIRAFCLHEGTYKLFSACGNWGWVWGGVELQKNCWLVVC